MTQCVAQLGVGGASRRGAPCELGKPPGGTGIGAGDLDC